MRLLVILFLGVSLCLAAAAPNAAISASKTDTKYKPQATVGDSDSEEIDADSPTAAALLTPDGDSVGEVETEAEVEAKTETEAKAKASANETDNDKLRLVGFVGAALSIWERLKVKSFSVPYCGTNVVCNVKIINMICKWRWVYKARFSCPSISGHTAEYGGCYCRSKECAVKGAIQDFYNRLSKKC